VDRGRLARYGPALLLALLLVLTVAATYASQRRVRDREHEALRTDAHAAVGAIGRRLDDYGQILRGAAAFYDASDDVTYQDFHNYFAAQKVVGRYPGVRVIGFASFVSRPELNAYVRRVRRESAASGLGYGSFALRPAPGPLTSEMVVIDHLEPTQGNTAAFGLDFLAEANRRRAALLARRTGRPAATAPISLVQAKDTSLGLDLMVPVYAGPLSQTGGLRPWAGVVYAAFRIDELLRGVLGQLGPHVELEVYDLGPAATVPADAGLRDRAGAVAFDLRPGRDMITLDDRTRVETLAVAGRRWAVAYRHADAALSAGERLVPWVIAIAGILVSLLAAALLYAMAGARARAVGLAETMTGELRERELQLQRSNEELEHFAYLASHDLQEPLRTIRSYVGLLEHRSADQLDERARSWLGFVSDGAERMSHLIADLLEYSRSGRATGEAQATALNDAWDLAVANLERSIADAGATVTRDELPVVHARPRELTSMLQNLIANGLKYRGATAPAVHAAAQRRDGGWELTVRDNGIGIDPRFHDRVFGLFQRLHTAEEYPGTGMGLAIVKKIVESNGGSVRVESTPGEGATFIVSLRDEDRA
jgi:signal transduction histidine kinase